MVQCDQCDGWFHGECVGVTTQEVVNLDQYICPTCMGDGGQLRCLCLSFSDSSDEETRSPTRGWANERRRQDRPEHSGESLEEPPRDPGEQARPKGVSYRRPLHRGTRESPCPLPGCRYKTRRMREQVTLVHLLPLFLREVPCAPEITRARKAVLDWVRIRLLGPRTSLLELSAQIPNREVFTCPAPIPDDIREAMDALCLEVGEQPDSTYALEGELHPALLLHWRVQDYLVGHLYPGSRWEYRGLLPGSGSTPGLHHEPEAASSGPEGRG